jgi:hypothetical protein
MRPRIAVIDGGTYYHHRALFGERYRGYFAEVIYVRDLWNTPLAHFDAVVFPDRLHPGPLVAARERIAEYLAAGGTVAAFGESQSHLWLPGLTWSPRPTNFWWWKTPGARLPLYAATQEHSLFRHLTIPEATWHVHGVFTPPSGAIPLIGLEGDGALLYEDTVTTPGRMVISSLDPFYHYGSYFMPVTERFLHGFLEWLAASCAGPPGRVLEQ